MIIDTSNWKEFRLCDICNIYMGNKLDFDKMNFDNPSINFIGRTASNNGIKGKVDKINGLKPYRKGCISIALGGSLGETFIQKNDFYTSQNVAVLDFSNEISDYAKLFIIVLIREECKYKYYPFGRELNSHINTDFSIKLPITQDGQPDWNYMEQFMKSLNWANIETKNKKTDVKLDVEVWKEFRVGDLFDIKKGKRLTDENQTKGNVPYIGAIDSNNGVSNFIGRSPIHKGNTISLSYDGSIGEAFYQPEPFWCTDAVNVLYFKESNNYRFNQYIALFICCLLKQEKYRYTYGRKWAIEKMEDTIILLPTTIDGQPNWEFMEQYIKSLPYGDLLN